MIETMKLYNLQNIYDLASGDQNFVKRLITISITETPETLSAMFEAYSKGDNETVKKLAHRIKPSIKNLGINTVVQDLLDLELGNNPQNTEQKLKHISTILIQVIMGLKADLDQISS